MHKIGGRLLSPAECGEIIIDLASVRASQTCWGYISKIITDLNMKLRRCIDLIEEMCTTQKP